MRIASILMAGDSGEFVVRCDAQNLLDAWHSLTSKKASSCMDMENQEPLAHIISGDACTIFVRSIIKARLANFHFDAYRNNFTNSST